MEIYNVTCGKEEEEFTDINKAVKHAEKICESSGVNAYLWGEVDGVRDEEPFFKFEWTL